MVNEEKIIDGIDMELIKIKNCKLWMDKGVRLFFVSFALYGFIHTVAMNSSALEYKDFDASSWYLFVPVIMMIVMFMKVIRQYREGLLMLIGALVFLDVMVKSIGIEMAFIVMALLLLTKSVTVEKEIVRYSGNQS